MAYLRLKMRIFKNIIFKYLKPNICDMFCQDAFLAFWLALNNCLHPNTLNKILKIYKIDQIFFLVISPNIRLVNLNILQSYKLFSPGQQTKWQFLTPYQ